MDNAMYKEDIEYVLGTGHGLIGQEMLSGKFFISTEVVKVSF